MTEQRHRYHFLFIKKYLKNWWFYLVCTCIHLSTDTQIKLVHRHKVFLFLSTWFFPCVSLHIYFLLAFNTSASPLVILLFHFSHIYFHLPLSFRNVSHHWVPVLIPTHLYPCCPLAGLKGHPESIPRSSASHLSDLVLQWCHTTVQRLSFYFVLQKKQ